MAFCMEFIYCVWNIKEIWQFHQWKQCLFNRNVWLTVYYGSMSCQAMALTKGTPVQWRKGERMRERKKTTTFQNLFIINHHTNYYFTVAQIKTPLKSPSNEKSLPTDTHIHHPMTWNRMVKRVKYFIMQNKIYNKHFDFLYEMQKIGLWQNATLEHDNWKESGHTK